MTNKHLLSIAILAVILAFIFKFQNVTMTMGSRLANSGSSSNFQNAITPPFYTKFSLAFYGFAIYTIYDIWSSLGFVSGLTAIAIIFFGSTLIKMFVMNNISDPFITKIIINSMVNRHANYVRDGDHVRAELMKDLIDRL